LLPRRFKERLNLMCSKRVAAWSGEQKFGLSPLHRWDYAGIAAALQSAVLGVVGVAEAIFRQASLM